ncbi:MAG: site-specific integrase [Methanosarcinaceae archaeon]|nr:site-specific integrase [Methanosarcinaceae archaeon]
MTKSVDDIHSIDSGFVQAMERLRKADIGQDNIDLLEKFVVSCRHEGLAKSTITGYVNYSTRMLSYLLDIGINKDINDLDQMDFEKLVMYLEDEKGLSPGGIRNYKKLIKKFMRWYYDDEPPKWVKNLKLKSLATPVQPQDLLTQEEFDKLVESCRHPRDKSFIAVLADSGMRIGALASCRIKNVHFNQYGAIIYISSTSRSKKSTAAKGIPITWSTGYLNQWLAVHPLKDDPEAPLWVTRDKNMDPLSYKSARIMIKNIGLKAGIKKRVNPHSFRHLAITHWILDGYNEQEIKHRAGWSKGSTQMFKIYANFTDQEINDRIFEKCGLKTEDTRHVTLKKCPRCSNVLRATDKFCSQCSLVLDREALDQIQEIKNTLPEIMQLVMKNEAARQIMEKMVRVKM